MSEKTPNTPIKTDYSQRTTLYRVIGENHVLRRPHTSQELLEPIKKDQNLTRAESDKHFAQLLIELEDKYGIRTPRMSMYRDGQTVFIEGQWVEGKNLSDDAPQLPLPILRQAAESIINYYIDATKNGGDYLTDLRPSNIIYGRLNGDTEDHLWFVDIEPRWATNNAGDPLPVKREFLLAEPELMFLLHEGKTRGGDWTDLQQKFEELKSLQD